MTGLHWLSLAVLLGPLAAVALWRWTDRGARILRARRRAERRTRRAAARRSDELARLHRRGVAE